MKPEALALFFDICVVTISAAVVILTLMQRRYISCAVSIFIWLISAIMFSIIFNSTTKMMIVMGAFTVVIITALYLIRKTLPSNNLSSDNNIRVYKK